MHVIDLNSSISLTKQNLQKYLHCIMYPAAFDATAKNVVVIDEPESIDVGGLPFLNEFLKQLRAKGISTPFVFVTNDASNQKLKTIKQKSVEFQFKRTQKNVIIKYLF